MANTVQRYEHKAMSTKFEVMIATDELSLARSAAHAVFTKIDRLEGVISRFLDTSEVAQIAQLKGQETFRVAPEVMDLLLLSTKVCAASKGAFDVTVGTVMDALREVKHRWSGLTPDEQQSALATCGMQRLIIDPTHFLVAVKPDRLGNASPLELDFGAIGKGYALDLASKILQEEWDFNDFLIHGGTSTVIARGSNGDGLPGWPVSVGGEWRARAKLKNIRLAHGAISGSGTEVKGAHVVDVRRGQAATRHAGVWSYAPTAALADALSTACLGLKWHEVRQTCTELEGCGVLIARQQPHWCDTWRKPLRRCGDFPT